MIADKRKMVFENIPTGYELRFLVDIGIALAAGFAIGAERESRNKPAGISTHCLVIGGAAIFTKSWRESPAIHQ